jgi:hypothetical protein
MSITALKVVTPPSMLPVTLKETKRHLRITHSAEDAHISDLIKAATSWAERETRRRLISQVVTFSMDRFPRRGEFAFAWGHNFENFGFQTVSNFGRTFDRRARDRQICLPGGVVTAVEKIDYIDETGAPQVLSGPTSTAPGTDYQEDLTDDEGAFLMPPDDSQWPGVDLGVVNAVVVQFTVGYAANSDGVPEDIKAAIKFRVGDLFNVRSTTDGKAGGIGTTASMLLEQHRIQIF